MPRNKIYKASLWVFILLILGCEVSNTDRKGLEDKTPARVVSIAPSMTEQLYLLGLQDRLVGVTVFCKYPPQAKSKEKVGTLLDPSLEKIVALSPDVVLAAEGNRVATIQRLKKVARVFVAPRCQDFDSIVEGFLALARLFKKEEQARKILHKLRVRIKRIKDKTKVKRRPKVFCQIGARPIITVAKGTHIDEKIWLAGGINIAHNSPIPYPVYSLEEVIKQDPDVIIVSVMGKVGTGVVEQWNRFKRLKAVRNGRVYVLDEHLVCTPTPSAFVDGLEEMASILHPEILK
jgi:iron complex transport system substrate-binding protein